MTKVQTLLKALESDRTMLDVQRRGDEAFNSFNIKSWKIKSRDQLLDCLSQFYWHVDSHIIDTKGMANPDPDYTKAMARDVVFKMYGDKGEKVAFDMASQGIEGGLYRVLKDFTAARVAYFTDNRLTALVATFFKDTSVEEQLKAAEDYAKEYARFLPKEYSEPGAWDVKMHFFKILMYHPHLIKRMREMGKT